MIARRGLLTKTGEQDDSLILDNFDVNLNGAMRTIHRLRKAGDLALRSCRRQCVWHFAWWSAQARGGRSSRERKMMMYLKEEAVERGG